MADSTETFQGWPNRETWAAALHIDNNADWYRTLTELARDADDLTAADTIREWFEETQDRLRDRTDRSMTEAEQHDWLMALFDIGSLWRVNWPAVVQHLRGETLSNPDDDPADAGDDPNDLPF